MFKRILIPLYFLIAVLTISINDKAGTSSGLSFSDITSDFSPEFMSTFANFINTGSAYYKDNTEKKLEYISEGLNQKFPVVNRRYSVFQQNQSVTKDYEAGWYVYNFRTIAGISKGVDLLNPNMSYMLSIEYNWNRTFINATGQKGVGLKQFELDIITDEIVRFETQNPYFCACHVGQILKRDLLQDWNQFCSTVENRYAVSAYVFDEKYIYFKPARCYHLFYVKYPGYPGTE